MSVMLLTYPLTSTEKPVITFAKRVRDVGTENFLMSPLLKGSLSCCCFPVLWLSVGSLLPSC